MARWLAVPERGRDGPAPDRADGCTPRALCARAAAVCAGVAAEFRWLRTPYREQLFTMTGDTLRMTGRECLGSWFGQVPVARRQEHHAAGAETEVLADLSGWPRAAGLIPCSHRHKFHAARVTHEADIGRCLVLVSGLGDWSLEAVTFPARVPQGDGLFGSGFGLRGRCSGFRLPEMGGRWSRSGRNWTRGSSWTRAGGANRPVSPALLWGWRRMT